MSDDQAPLTPPWAYYRRKGLSEMRPYVLGEDLDGISVSDVDRRLISFATDKNLYPGGYIARNPENHADQWYVAQAYFDKNLEPAAARDEAAELRAAISAALHDLETSAGLYACDNEEGRSLFRLEHASIPLLRRLAGDEQ